jgi:3-oxoacyl-[acyl-carrier-protein] synthase-3
MNLTFDGIGISGLAAAVPGLVIDNLNPPENFTREEAERVVNITGVRYRRRAAPAVCASDICCVAADRLIVSMNLDRSSIDVILFISHSPDYRKPATSLLLQHRLGLSRAVALDINLGCSGFVYGLFTAYSMLTNPGVKRVLLLNGETLSRSISQKDKATGLLFGDSGTATLIEKSDAFGTSWFSLHSDGARSNLIMTPAGGYRNQSSASTVTERMHEDGSIRSDEHTVMDGAGIFTFMLADVYRDLLQISAWSGLAHDKLDYVVLHQANRFAMEHLRKKLNIPPAKFPYSLDDFGNTSGPSIPLTLVTRLVDPLRKKNNWFLLSGFGVGLSWGSVILDIGPIPVCELVEMEMA